MQKPGNKETPGFFYDINVSQLAGQLMENFFQALFLFLHG